MSVGVTEYIFGETHGRTHRTRRRAALQSKTRRSQPYLRCLGAAWVQKSQIAEPQAALSYDRIQLLSTAPTDNIA